MTNPILDHVFEKATGIPAETLRRMPLEDIRALAEKRHGKAIYPPPFISHEEVNKQLDKALKKD